MKTNKITPEVQAMLNAAPEFTEKQAGVKPGKVIARGFATYKQNINKNGRPTVDDPKVVITVRIPSSYAKELRASGRGWQTRTSDYVVSGIKRGAIGKAETQ